MDQDEKTHLRAALSASFGAYTVDKFSDMFLEYLVAQLPSWVVRLADEWTWNDTEVREEVCQAAEKLLGGDSEEAYMSWLRTNQHKLGM